MRFAAGWSRTTCVPALALCLSAASAERSVAAQGETCAPLTAAADSALRRLVEAVNVGTYAAIDGVVRESWDPSRIDGERGAALRTMLGRWHWQSTRLAPVRRCAVGAGGYAVLRDAQTGELDSLDVAIIPVTGRIARLGLVQGVDVPVAAADTASDVARAAALRTLTRRMAADGGFSGEVLFAHDGRILYHEAVGVVDRGTGRRARLGEPYSIASTGKLVTATAVMQLVERGRLSLDDTLGAFLTPGERPAGAAGVPLKTMLSHTDGMTNGADSLAFRPGTRFSYVNYGYYLLGTVIEKVTGRPFAEHFASAIFAPLGMRATRRLERTAPDPSLAPAYEFRFDSAGPHLVPNPLAQTIAATGAGGLFSSALDLFRLAEALRTGRVLRASTVAEMRTPRRELGAVDYGYGIDLFRGHNVWGHSGLIPGAEAELELYGDSGYVFVLLSNTATGDPIRRRVNALVGTRAFCETPGNCGRQARGGDARPTREG